MKKYVILLGGLLLVFSVALANQKEVTMEIQMISEVEAVLEAWWGGEGVACKNIEINLGNIRMGEEISKIEEKEIYVVASKKLKTIVEIPKVIELKKNNSTKKIIIPLMLVDKNGSTGLKMQIGGNLDSTKSREIFKIFKTYNNLEDGVDHYFGADFVELHFLTQKVTDPPQPGSYSGSLEVVITPSW